MSRSEHGCVWQDAHWYKVIGRGEVKEHQAHKFLLKPCHIIATLRSELPLLDPWATCSWLLCSYQEYDVGPRWSGRYTVDKESHVREQVTKEELKRPVASWDRFVFNCVNDIKTSIRHFALKTGFPGTWVGHRYTRTPGTDIYGLGERVRKGERNGTEVETTLGIFCRNWMWRAEAYWGQKHRIGSAKTIVQSVLGKDWQRE